MPDKRLLNALKQPANTALQKGTPYQVGQIQPVAPELPPQASALSSRLQDLARQYLGARRRSGEALLDAARWLSEARTEAQHGEWLLFLEATNTTSDTADRLIHIHTRALENPQFADAISRNWLSQSTAALLARPSTPPEVIGEVLQSDRSPTKADVDQKIRAARTPAQPTPPQIPHSAEFESAAPPRTQSLTLHAELVDRLRTIARRDGRDVNAVLSDALDMLERAQQS